MRVFSLPVRSSAISFDGQTVRFVRLIRTKGVISVDKLIEDVAPDIASFVAKHHLSHEIVSVSAKEEEAFYKFLEKEDGITESPEVLLSEHLPKGLDAEAVSMERHDIPHSGGVLLHFLHNDVTDRITHELASAHLVLNRIGGGVTELGLALQPFVDKAFTGTVLVVEPKICHVLIFTAGAFSDCQTLHAGQLHLEENPVFFFNEVARFLVFYWETKRLKPALQELRLLSPNPALESLFASHGFSVSCMNVFSDASAETPPPSLLVGKGVGGMGQSFFPLFALAFNTLTQRLGAINHHPVMDTRLRHALLIQKAQALLLRFVLPITGMLLLSLLLLLLGFTGLRHGIEKRLNIKGGAVEKTLMLREENREFQETIHEARTLVQGHNFESQVFQWISRAMPKEVWLTSLQYDHESKLVINGVSGHESAIQTLYTNLEKEKRFSNVRLLFTERLDKQEIARKSSRVFGQSLVRFSIEMDAP